jgi:hypothetical protein
LTVRIRGFGSEVEVLEPEELRTESIADLRKNLSVQKPLGSSFEVRGFLFVYSFFLLLCTIQDSTPSTRFTGTAFAQRTKTTSDDIY